MYKLVIADYSNPSHATDILKLMCEYAQDEMGKSQKLNAYATENLIKRLEVIDGAFSILCYYDTQCVGLANCFTGFSTFKCKPLINIHDFFVRKKMRGKNIAHLILTQIERMAAQKDCCKITLEVLENNHHARRAYTKYGFKGYELDPSAGKALFWEKPIPPYNVEQG